MVVSVTNLLDPPFHLALSLKGKGGGLLSILGRLAAKIVIYSRAPRLLTAADGTFI